MVLYKTKNQYKFESNSFIFANIRTTKIKSIAESEPHTKYHKRTVTSKFRSNVFVIKPIRCTSFTAAGPGWNFSSILVLLESCLQTCMTYTIVECTVNELLMMDRRTVRNM